MSTPAINDDSQTVILLCNTATPGSQMCWFNGAPAAEDNQAPVNPGDIAVVAPGSLANANGYIIWEGQQITGLFGEHLGFEVQIQGNAAAQPINTLVGQGYHSPPFAPPPPGQPPYQFNVFNIYRDNDRVVYTDPALGAVSTIYYCTYVGPPVSLFSAVK